MVEVLVDVGGTFTDCLILQTDADGTPRRSAIKVLSSGLVSVKVMHVNQAAKSIDVELPPTFAVDGFWTGAALSTNEGSPSPPFVRTITRCERMDDKTGVLRWHMNESCQVFAVDQTLTLDAGIESPVLATRLLLGVPLRESLPSLSVRMGTTRGTNALLTRRGAPTVLLTTEGFADLLAIGTQDRPDLFSLDIVKPVPLASQTIEVRGRLDASGNELIPIDEADLRRQLIDLRQSGPHNMVLAICLLHSHQNDAHERHVERIAREVGFANIIRSTAVAPLPRIVPRAETTTLDAYLQPVLEDYVRRVLNQFGGETRCDLRWMTSGGNLVASNDFHGRDSVLSGPAGGVVALAQVARQCGVDAAVGLDMGGTSTDVSRFEGTVGRRQESMIAGVRVLTPMMDIHTVASGGGSICDVRDGRLIVGPDSAGAAPGPACYGRGGPLTITDVNVLLGRLPIDRFPFPLDLNAAREALEVIHQRLPSGVGLSADELADGFLQLAVTQMAEAVRVVTTAAGSDPRKMALVGFGGAAGGHLCRVADALEMTHAIDHPDAGILSAVGMGAATIGRIFTQSIQLEIAEPSSVDQPRTILPGVSQTLNQVAERTHAHCVDQLRENENVTDETSLQTQHQCDVRVIGTQSTLSVDLNPIETLPARFDDLHRLTFGYARNAMPIEIVAMRCEVTIPSREPSNFGNPKRERGTEQQPTSTSGITTWNRESIPIDQTMTGPAIITSDHSVLIVEESWNARMNANGVIELRRPNSTGPSVSTQPTSQTADQDDTIAMEIVARRVQGIAEAMGEVIRRTSVSVNVKERRDYSCAVFLGDGSLVANAPHVPVHLGAMGHTVRSLMSTYPVMSPGDAYISNDPYSGGSHLPDVTVVTPIFCDADSNRPSDWPCDFFVASRCHHAEIGGIVPGSMAPAATCLAEEGVVIRNECLVRDGQSRHAAIEQMLSTGRFPSRNVRENMADISAAEAAGRDGAMRIAQLANTMGVDRMTALLQRLLHVAGEATATWIESLGELPRRFTDAMDDGTPVCVELTPDQTAGRLRINFTGTGPVHPGGLNATRSIVTAAVLYVLRCVSPGELPLCDGVLRRIDLVIPPGLLDPPAGDHPETSPAVVAGNVETSNRVVDVLLGALGVAAASQGTMNNLLLGDDTFGYYETIGGGAGATATMDGADAVHTHMTNTRITDPEVLESRLPIRLWRFGIRRGSGGNGHHRGGDGIIREMEFLRPLTLSLITSRRTTRAFGLRGGDAGQSGMQTLIRGSDRIELPFAVTRSVLANDRLILQTPGGGGYGRNGSTISSVS